VQFGAPQDGFQPAPKPAVTPEQLHYAQEPKEFVRPGEPSEKELQASRERKRLEEERSVSEAEGWLRTAIDTRAAGQPKHAATIGPAQPLPVVTAEHVKLAARIAKREGRDYPMKTWAAGLAKFHGQDPNVWENWLLAQKKAVEEEASQMGILERMDVMARKGASGLTGDLVMGADWVLGVLRRADTAEPGATKLQQVLRDSVAAMKRQDFYTTPERRKFGESFFGALADYSALNAPYVAGVILATVANPWLAFGGVFAQATGSARERLVNSGIDTPEADLAALASGVVTAITEVGGTMFQLKLIAGKNIFANRLFTNLAKFADRNALTRSGASGAVETLQETTQQTSEEGLVRWAGGKPNEKFW
jgi:hypothetical protein